MANTVIGIFNSADEARVAVEELVEAGFLRNSIDMSAYSGQNGDVNNTTSVFDNDRDRDGDRNEGGISGFFASLFGDDDDDRDRYTTVASRSSVVTVHTQSADEAERAADILDDAGAVDVNEQAEQFRSGTYQAGTAANLTDTTNLRDTDVTGRMDETVKVPIIEENLQVGKQTVETGGVRLRSRIVERPVEEHLRLREERVNVQRTPVDRPASDADFTTFKEGEVELVEHAERAMVNKEARVVEEVSLGKEVTERDETIHDTVRRTDVEVENLGSTEKRLTDTDYNTTNRSTDSDDVTYANR